MPYALMPLALMLLASCLEAFLGSSNCCTPYKAVSADSLSRSTQVFASTTPHDSPLQFRRVLVVDSIRLRRSMPLNAQLGQVWKANYAVAFVSLHEQSPVGINLCTLCRCHRANKQLAIRFEINPPNHVASNRE